MVSAIILNYLNPELTHKCVGKLLNAAHLAGIAVEVIVVDNSAPETAEELRKILPNDVIIIENEQNTGFAKANNQGIRKAKGDIILIMNNDLFINKETLKNGINYLKSNADVGIWAPKLTDSEGNSQRSCSQFPTLIGLAAEYFLKIQYDNRIAKSAVKCDQPVAVDAVIGACMLVPQKALQEVGGFDEDYFFNSEDVDLCRRLKAIGYDIVLDPRCSAIHLVGASQDSHWHENRHLHEGRILYFRKNHHPVKAIIAKTYIKTGIKMREIKHRIFS